MSYRCRHGELSVGFGGDHEGVAVGGKTNKTEIGPELGFGWALGDAYAAKGVAQQVLIIKTAWGGKTIDIVRQLRHHLGPSLRHTWVLYCPPHAVYCALLGCHAYWMLIGACDPML